MSTPDPFRYDDAAYVLGALSPQERRDFEAHLTTCRPCTARVAELQTMPELLGAVGAADVDAMFGAEAAAESAAAESAAAEGEHTDVPDTLLAGLMRTARRERRRRFTVTAGLAAAVAAAVVGIAVAVVPSHHSPAGTPMAAIGAEGAGSGVQASAFVQTESWGTEIKLTCRYQARYPAQASYQLLIVDKSGVTHVAGSWRLDPTKVTTFTGGTWLDRSQISKIEIADPDQTPILALPL